MMPAPTLRTINGLCSAAGIFDRSECTEYRSNPNTGGIPCAYATKYHFGLCRWSSPKRAATMFVNHILRLGFVIDGYFYYRLEGETLKCKYEKEAGHV